MLKSNVFRVAFTLALAMEEVSGEAQKLEEGSDERKQLANVVSSLEEAITELTWEE